MNITIYYVLVNMSVKSSQINATDLDFETISENIKHISKPR